MSPFQYFSARCKACGNTMRIGDHRFNATDIKRMLESGEAISGHTADCPAGQGNAPMQYDVRLRDGADD